MKIPTHSITKRNPPLLLAAVACDIARKVLADAQRAELGKYLRGAKVVSGKCTYLTGNNSANHELSLYAGPLEEALKNGMGPFVPGVRAWKVRFA